MSDDLTDSQKAVIRQLVSDCIATHDRHQIEHIARETIDTQEDKYGWLRRTHLDGDVETGDERPVPTKSKVDSLADGAVDRWKKQRPKWYDVRRRLDSASALVVALLAVGGLIYEMWDGEKDDLPALFHAVAGTDDQIDARVLQSRTEWVKSDIFSNATGNAFRNYAQNNPEIDNPIRKLVAETLEANPVLVFHGQQLMSDETPLSIHNEDCIPFVMGLVSLVTQDQDREIPEAIGIQQALKVCSSDVVVSGAHTLDVPFFARFPGAPGGGSDEAYLILHIEGTGKGADGKDVDFGKPGATGGLQGLCVTYRTTDVNQMAGENAIPDGLFVGDVLKSSGHGFWYGNITGKVVEALGGDGSGQPDPQNLLHSLHVEYIRPTETLAEEEMAEDAPDPKVCETVARVTDVNITVRALLLVNKEAR